MEYEYIPINAGESITEYELRCLGETIKKLASLAFDKHCLHCPNAADCYHEMRCTLCFTAKQRRGPNGVFAWVVSAAMHPGREGREG